MGARSTSMLVAMILTLAQVGCSDDGGTGTGGTGGAGGSGGSGGGSLDCRFNATVDGEYSATFDGAAQWETGEEGSLVLTLRSGDAINDGTDPYVINVATGSLDDLAPGTYTIVAGGIENASATAETAQYIQGVEGFDCSNCGGTVEIDAVDGDGITGGFALTAPLTMADAPGEVTIAADFNALDGSESNPDSPYRECEITYEE